MPLPRFYLLDGAVIIHCLLTIGVSTFNEYADILFIPYLEKQLQNGKRVDAVWGKYMSDSVHQGEIWTNQCVDSEHSNCSFSTELRMDYDVGILDLPSMQIINKMFLYYHFVSTNVVTSNEQITKNILHSKTTCFTILRHVCMFVSFTYIIPYLIPLF